MKKVLTTLQPFILPLDEELQLAGSMERDSCVIPTTLLNVQILFQKSVAQATVTMGHPPRPSQKC